MEEEAAKIIHQYMINEEHVLGRHDGKPALQLYAGRFCAAVHAGPPATFSIGSKVVKTMESSMPRMSMSKTTQMLILESHKMRPRAWMKQGNTLAH